MIHFGLKIYLSQNSKLRQSLSYLQKLQHTCTYNQVKMTDNNTILQH